MNALEPSNYDKNVTHETIPGHWSLEFVTMDVFGPWLRTTSGDQQVVVMRKKYLRLTRVVPTLKTSTARGASIFYDY